MNWALVELNPGIAAGYFKPFQDVRQETSPHDEVDRIRL
jgi:hypothetical protein